MMLSTRRSRANQGFDGLDDSRPSSRNTMPNGMVKGLAASVLGMFSGEGGIGGC